MAFRNHKEIEEKIKKIVNAKVKNSIARGLDLKYAQELKDRIVKRTQLGGGVNTETGSTKRLKPLSKNYKDQRQGKARWYTSKAGIRIKVKKNKTNGDFVKPPKLDSTTTPAKSNLTATGQLLRSLTVVKVKLQGGVQFVIAVGDRRGRGLFGYPSSIGNKKLVEYLAAQGRTFLGFTKSQKNEISRDIRQIIIKFLK